MSVEDGECFVTAQPEPHSDLEDRPKSSEDEREENEEDEDEQTSVGAQSADDDEEEEEEEEDAMREKSLLLFRQQLEDERQRAATALEALSSAEAQHCLELITHEEYDFARRIVDTLRAIITPLLDSEAALGAVLAQLHGSAAEILKRTHQRKRRRTTEDGLAPPADVAQQPVATPASTALFKRLLGGPAETEAEREAESARESGEFPVPESSGFPAEDSPLAARPSVLNTLVEGSG